MTTNVNITFEGHGLWGVGGGGGGIPEDALLHGVVKPGSVEYRGARSGKGKGQKLYYTVVHDSGYEMYDNVTPPSPGSKPGVEKAFTRLLMAIGYIAEESAEKVNAGALKGKSITLDSVIEKLGQSDMWFDFKKPRGRGDYKQVTYLFKSEVEAIKAGTLPPISDDRGPAPGAPVASVAASELVLPSTPTLASAPLVPTAPLPRP